MSEVIPLNLVRGLQFKKDDKVWTGELRITRLERMTERKWACYWSCDYLCDDGHVFGEDALHALSSCLKLIKDLITHAPASGLQVWWQSAGDGAWLD